MNLHLRDRWNSWWGGVLVSSCSDCDSLSETLMGALRDLDEALGERDRLLDDLHAAISERDRAERDLADLLDLRSSPHPSFGWDQ